MKTRLLITAFALLIPLATYAQPVVTQYAYTFGGTSFDVGKDVGVDDAGNAYFIGTFNGTFDFDPGAGTASLSSTRADVYIVSYDETGDLRFAFQLGNAFATTEAAGGIAVDGSGAFYVTGGSPFGTIDYDPDPADTEDRSGRIFIAGYDDSGDFRFAVTPESASRTAGGQGNAIALDGAGNIYVTGRFTGTMDFDPASAVPAEITSNGSHDVFVASYTTDGDYRYAFGVGGTGWDEGHGIAADAAGNVYVTGRFSDTVSFDPDDTNNDGDTEDRTTTSSGELFFASYSPAGEFRFVYTFGNSNSAGHSLDTDAAGNVYLTGEFRGTTAFDPDDTDGDGDLEERTAAGNGSAFVAGYGSGGDFLFASAISGGHSFGRDIVADASGISFATGSFGGTIDPDAGAGTSTLSSGSGTDVFVVSYDATGAYRGGFSFGGDGLNAGTGIAIDLLGTTAVTGEFTGTTDFDPDPASTSDATSAGQNDLFMASYSYEPISLLPPPPPGCPDGLFISDFDSDQGIVGDDGDDTGEYIVIEHLDDEAVSLNDCALVFFDGRNDKSYFAMQLAGDLDAGDSHVVGNPGVAGADQTFPDATLQNGPDAIAILDRTAASVPNRTRVVNVVNDVVAAVVYVSDGNIFGQVPAPAVAKHAADLPALLKGAAVGDEAPTSFKLEANYPNPFNPSTVIPFTLAEEAHVMLDVFDVTGRRIVTLIDGAMQAGAHEVHWNGQSLAGGPMPSGVYVYRIRAGRFTQSRGMLLAK